ncbi:hypothetical protein [Oricola sp.]|uniref:hypothetical protein n=1 Tax=Oricola sp. TaxID=1979950 RepID=UPI003BAC1503
MQYNLDNIVFVFSEFADEDMQMESWFRLSSDGYDTSPDDMIGWIDDNLVAEWNEDIVKSVDPDLHRYIADFVKRAQDGSDVDSDPWRSYSSPKWVELRLMAKVIVETIRERMDALKSR